MPGTMLVTGASGFVGGAIARAAVRAGWRVVTTSRRDAAVEGATHVRWDLDSGALTGDQLRAIGDVDVVVHAAAHVGEWGQARAIWRTTVGGTRAVLASFPRAQIVHISTASVYDPMRPSVQVREHAPRPDRYLTSYARAKAAAEQVVLADGSRREGEAAARRGVVVLRPHAVYGPGDTTLLPRVLGAVRGGRLLLPGGGTALQSLTGIGNLVGAVLRASEVPVPAPMVVNVADAEPVVLREALEELFGRRGMPAVRVIALPVRPSWWAAAVAETFYRASRAKKPPRLTRYAISHLATERTLDLTVLRDRLGFDPAPTSFEGAADW